VELLFFQFCYSHFTTKEIIFRGFIIFLKFVAI